MKRSSYTDDTGRKHAVWLPDNASEAEAHRGIPLGPPLLDLGMPEVVAVRLHNELFYRDVFTLKDVSRRRMDVIGALQAALQIDADRIVAAYTAHERDITG